MIGLTLRFFFVYLLLFTWLAPSARAEDSGRLDAEMELFKTESVDPVVTTSTSTAQRASLAPSVISVITAQDLKNWGVTSLAEALVFVPGVIAAETFFGYTAINFRGLLQSHYNNKVLMLVNGHPVREAVNGSFHLEMIPLNVIDRVEVIRGPGSALYGTNALAGVINIITRRGISTDGHSTEVGLLGGSYQTVGGDLFWSHQSPSSQTVAAASGQDNQGFPWTATDEASVTKTKDYENDMYNAFVEHQRGPWTISVAGFRQQKEKFGIVPNHTYGGPTKFVGFLGDIKYTKALSEQTQLTSRLRYDELERESPALPVGVFMNPRGYQAAADFSLSHQFHDNLGLLGGVTYEYSYTDPYWFTNAVTGAHTSLSAYTNSYHNNDTSLFFQVLWNHQTAHQWTFGGRFNSNSDTGSIFAPRLGYVWAINETTTFKALLAEAFRNPDFFEKRVNTPTVLFGDKDLKRENVDALDLAIEKVVDDRQKHTVNAFYLDANDAITRTPTGSGSEGRYTNDAHQHLYGLEYAFEHQFENKSSGFLSYRFNEGQDALTDTGLKYVAKHAGSVGLVWRASERLQITPTALWVDERGNTASFGVVNLTVNYQIAEQWSLSLIGKNLADEDYAYPEYIRQKIDDIPAGPGASVFVKLLGTLN